MSYLRTISVTVSGGGRTIDLSKLDAKFVVKQDTVQAPNLLELRIYNVAPMTAQQIPMQGGTITLAAGYSDETTGIIFQGEIAQRRIGRETVTKTFVDIFGKEGDNAYNYAYVSKTLAAGSMPMDHLKVAADAMKPFGISLGYVTSSILMTPKYPRAVSWASMARDVLRTLSHSVNGEWSIQGTKLLLVGQKDNLPGGPRIVNSQTGMIGQPVETPGGIMVRTLLDSRIVVHSLLQINEKSIQRAQVDQSFGGMGQSISDLSILGTNDGVYKVLYIERRGHLRGQEWYNDCTCIGAYNGTTPNSLAGILTTSDGNDGNAAQTITNAQNQANTIADQQQDKEQDQL